MQSMPSSSFGTRRRRTSPFRRSWGGSQVGRGVGQVGVAAMAPLVVPPTVTEPTVTFTTPGHIGVSSIS